MSGTRCAVRGGASALVLACALPLAIHAQSITLSGRLLRLHGADSVPIPAQLVVVHQVSEARQGPVDSQRTDAAGRFRFVVRQPDTGSVYIVSSRWQGIGYFSEPFSRRGAAPVDLVVFDTTVAGPDLLIGIRHVVITRGESGQRRVLDIFQVVNPGQATRVGRDSLATVWTTHLPDDIRSPQPGESDVPAAAVRFSGSTLDVMAPFPPGPKQVVVTYDLDPGRRRLEIPVDQPTGQFEILVEDSTATASGAFESAEPITIEGRTFRRYAADSVAAGTNPVVTFGSTGGSSGRYQAIAIVVAALALGAGAWIAVRKRPPRQETETVVGESTMPDESRERLIAQIAALDDKFEGREGETAPEQWASYQARRAELKAALARRVARDG